MEKKDIGTVISTIDSPNPSSVDFVVTKGIVHRGQFVEMDYSEGTLVALVNDVIKTNRYFERADSVKEFESNGSALFEQFPTGEWEFLVAKTRLLGVFSEKFTKRATYPPSPGTRVRIASNENLQRFLNFDNERGLHLGKIDYHNLDVNLNLSSLLKKHIAILALSGGGKCVSPSTKVLLSTGVAREIGALVDKKLSKGFEVEDGVEFCRNQDPDLKVFSITDKNKIVHSKVKAFCRRPAPKQMFRVNTSTGKTLELTQDHLVPILDEKMKWVKAKNLKEGDCLLLPKPRMSGTEQHLELHYSSRSLEFHKKIVFDKDFARLFAYLLAEGHNTGRYLVFSNSSDAIKKDFSMLCEKVFGLKARRIKRENELRVYSKALAVTLGEIGFTGSSWTKFVPNELLASKKGVVAAFLGAFIDCDGYISGDKGLEICLASRKLIEQINSMILRFGVVPIQKEKTVKGKKYSRLFVNTSRDLRILKNHLNLLIDYKRENLIECCKRLPNPNLDVVPNISKNVEHVMKLLNMSLSQANSTGIANYLYRNNNPSFESLKKLTDSFDKRLEFLELKIYETRNIFYSLPNIFEDEARQIVSEAYEEFDFNQISNRTSVSATTARRLVRGITSPTKSAFVLARQALLLQGKSDLGLDIVSDLDFQLLAEKTKNLCSSMGFELREICVKSLLHKNYLYQATNMGRGSYSSLYAILQNLFIKALNLKKNLELARKRISFLKSLVNSNLFFDKVSKAETFRPNFKYVYDLAVEKRNFTANNLIIHNSYLASVLFEELLERKKEDGRIATIVLDPHGEYSCFAEPPDDKSKKDYSSKTKLVKARDIQIGVPKLSVGILAGIIPGLSSAQKRDLGKIFTNLKSEMRNGLGPFDLSDVLEAINSSHEIKENTKAALAGWIFGLIELKIFGKTDAPSIYDLLTPGNLTIIDLSDLIDVRKKQIIVSYFAQRLFYERRNKTIPPFLLVLEEAHQFVPQNVKSETAISRSIIRTIAREGRKFGASLCLISQRPVQLDTTALSQCVSSDTRVLLADEKEETIGALRDSWHESQVLACDILKGSIEKAPISAYLKSNPFSDGKKCFRITTESGRVLRCTSDHPLWVKEKGWVNAEKIKKEGDVAILPIISSGKSDSFELKLSEDQISAVLPHSINRERLYGVLRQQGLLDTVINQEKILALARIIGHIFGDGSLHPPYKNSKGQHSLRATYSGCEEDLLEVKKDIALLGFNNNQKILKEEKISYSNFINFGRKRIKGISTYFKTGIVGLWAVLRVLEAPMGCKTDNKVLIPNWILNANKDVKREFLASLCGSECSAIRWKGRFPERLILPFSKSETMLPNGESFAKQLMDLFEEFEVETSLYKRDYVLRKDGTKSVQFILYIKRNRNNLINFFKNVNYRCSVKKRASALHCLEYLKWLNIKTLEKRCLWRKIKKLSATNSVEEISTSYNMNRKIVRNWAAMTAQKVRLAPSDKILSFQNWIEQKTRGLSGGLIWDKIKEVREIRLNDVRDITVPDYHCFFANGFLTHNCNTHIILRITNPYDLKHIGESSEGLDKKSEEMISSLRVGEALIVGEATHYPLFFKVRARKSQESKHEISLEEAARRFEEIKGKNDSETKELLQ